MGGFSSRKVEKLTEDQKQLVEENHNLIYKVLYDHHLDIDEWYDVAAIALCKAAMGFDPERNFQFSTYACAAIWNNICREYTLGLADKIIPEDKIYSLDYEYGTDGDVYTMKDYYEDKHSFEDDILIKERFIKGLDKMKSPRDKGVIVMVSEGYTYAKVGKVYGISRERVRQIVREYAYHVGYKVKKNKGYNRRGA